LSIASHHFDTQFPSSCDSTFDGLERLYLPNIALFRLVYILGEIMNDAVSFRPVPYDSILAHDRALSQWLESLPEEIVLDDYQLARSLASPLPAILRPGVLCIVARTAFYHIRFTLHRPYTSASGKLSRKAESVEIAVATADKLITIVEQTRPDFLANQVLVRIIYFSNSSVEVLTGSFLGTECPRTRKLEFVSRIFSRAIFLLPAHRRPRPTRSKSLPVKRSKGHFNTRSVTSFGRGRQGI
jgi:hypothetical protein